MYTIIFVNKFFSRTMPDLKIRTNVKSTLICASKTYKSSMFSRNDFMMKSSWC